MTLNKSSGLPAGYVRYQVGKQTLVIPQRLANELDRQCDDQEPPGNQEPPKNVPPSPPPQLPAPSREDDASSATRHRVYDWEQVIDLKARQKFLRDPDDRARMEKLHQKLCDAGLYRRVGQPPYIDAAIAELESLHPNYRAPIAMVAAALRLAASSGQPPCIPPMLLVGEPGIGKSHFARELARLLNTSQGSVHYDTGATHANLLGLDRMWGNSKYGILFELICLGDYCNPVVILDEIDKAIQTAHDDPLSPLHTLLEPSTAALAKDLSVEFTFDASLVTYIATANSLAQIPLPLRSRLRVFRISFPDARQALDVAKFVARQCVKEVAPRGFAPPSREVIFELAHLTAREIRQAITQGVAAAIAEGRNELRVKDLPVDYLWDPRVSGSGLH